MADQEVELFLCPHCLLPGDEPGPCPNCGAARLSCRPGDADDPCRKPLMDGAGRVQTRAPLWWLHYTVGRLTDFLERG